MDVDFTRAALSGVSDLQPDGEQLNPVQEMNGNISRDDVSVVVVRSSGSCHEPSDDAEYGAERRCRAGRRPHVHRARTNEIPEGRDLAWPDALGGGLVRGLPDSAEHVAPLLAPKAALLCGRRHSPTVPPTP